MQDWISLDVSWPIGLLVVLPFLLLLGLQIKGVGRRPTIAVAGLGFLRRNVRLASLRRKYLHACLWAFVAFGLAIIWAEPTIRTSQPLLGSDPTEGRKNILLMVDISRSMGVPLGAEKNVRLPGQPPGKTVDVDESVSRYTAARQALVDFVDRFSSERIGLIVFSTEPFLARWPSTITETRFREVLHENIGRGELSQLQAFSSLTNINKALDLARSVFLAQRSMSGGAIVMISDAEDDIENIGVAVRNLRKEGVRIYTVGVGISEQVIADLSEEFRRDPGFRIFRAESETEIQEAYRLVAELEESPSIAGDRSTFARDLRPFVAWGVFVAGALVLTLSETVLHQTRVGGRRP